MPFEVPDNWEWCKLEEICNIKGGKRIPKGKGFSTQRTEHIYLRVTNMKNRTISFDDLKYIDDDVFQEIRNYTISSDDLYLTIAGTIGNVGEIPQEVSGMNLTENAAKLTDIVCDRLYLMYSLLSTNSQEHFSSKYHQVAQPKLSIETASSTLLPLPPFAEQRRIVAEIERWFTMIDIIENDQYDLQTTVKQTKSKILDLAIHGKLVPQDPNDEPAIKLLKRINPDFTPCDNGHYENLPDGWGICRLEDIVDYEQPTAYIVNSTSYNDSYPIPVLTAGKSFIIGYTNEVKGIYSKLPCIIFDDFTTDSKFVDFPFKVKSSAMKILQIRKDVETEYVAMFMNTTRLIGDTHKRYWISEYSKLTIPIPPKAEQKRIVDTVHTAFAKLDTIMESL